MNKETSPISSSPALSVFSNYSNDVPLSMTELCNDLKEVVDAHAPGWPKVVAGQICCWQNDGPRGKSLRTLESSPELFGWIGRFAEVCWRRGGVTKEELFCELPQSLERYEWA